VGPILIVTYLVVSLFWVVAMSSLVVWQALASGIPLHTLDSPALIDLLGPKGFALQSLVQSAGFVVICVAMIALLNQSRRTAFHTKYRVAFALRSCSGRYLGIGLVGGLFVGIFPGWLVDQLRSRVPDLDLGTLELITELFAVADRPALGLLCVTLVIVAPLTEELVFRGFLWDASLRFMPPWAVWIGTSLLFSLYHMSLIQSLALLFTGSFIGFLRWTSGSIWPAIAAHGTNNLLATVAVWSGMAAGDGTIPWWSATSSGLLTVGLCVYAWRIRGLE